MRRIVVSVLAWITLAVTCACTNGGAADPNESEAPPLSQQSPATTPTTTRTPGPALSTGCALASAAEVAAAAGLNSPTVKEEQLGTGAVGCHYQAGNNYATLFVATGPSAGGSPEAQASLAIQSYKGTLEKVDGLGDAAYYLGGFAQVVVAAVDQGSTTRVVTVIGYLASQRKEQLVAFVRTILSRI